MREEIHIIYCIYIYISIYLSILLFVKSSYRLIIYTEHFLQIITLKGRQASRTDAGRLAHLGICFSPPNIGCIG